MIEQLEIYSLGEKSLRMLELTNNTIVLFNNWELKNKFVHEFLKISREDADAYTEDIDFLTTSDIEETNKDDEKSKIEIKEFVSYMPTSIFTVNNEQRFVFTTEAPFVLQCKNPNDLWFCCEKENREIEVYALTDFKDYKEDWEVGVDQIYKGYIGGIYGCHNGYGN